MLAEDLGLLVLQELRIAVPIAAVVARIRKRLVAILCGNDKFLVLYLLRLYINKELWGFPIDVWHLRRNLMT
jgi:hypothetical protein